MSKLLLVKRNQPWRQLKKVPRDSELTINVNDVNSQSFFGNGALSRCSLVKLHANVKCAIMASEEMVTKSYDQPDYKEAFERVLSFEDYTCDCNTLTIQKLLHVGGTTDIPRIGTITMIISLTYRCQLLLIQMHIRYHLLNLRNGSRMPQIYNSMLFFVPQLVLQSLQ